MNNTLTIDDIHKIRIVNYEQTKTLSNAELIKKTKQGAKAGRERVASIKEKQTVSVVQ